MPKYPYNDWSKPPSDLGAWADEVREQAKKKFGVDSDGDCPVRVSFIDRTKYEPMHYRPVPYEHEAKTPEQLEKVEEALLINLDTALSQLTRFRALQKSLKREK